MPLAGDKSDKPQKSRNLKAHLRLIQIAESCEESVFQKNGEYLKFKGQKNISTWDHEALQSFALNNIYFLSPSTYLCAVNLK